ncbi:hypothetical protein Bca4012_074452 [Brassica carinata]|uniref:Uncharacterized protein n=1 Tax=Brassica carinata TaxID=52824 RepID=A0A8X7UDN3_BRACI|nr:hypothetical protein Bca52824_066721 [Brassica carinata]
MASGFSGDGGGMEFYGGAGRSILGDTGTVSVLTNLGFIELALHSCDPVVMASIPCSALAAFDLHSRGRRIFLSRLCPETTKKSSPARPNFIWKISCDVTV